MSRRKTRRDSGDANDEIKEIVKAWRRARPDLDFRLMGLVLRMQRFTFAFRRNVEKMASGTQVKSGDMFVLLALRRAVPDCALRPTDLFRTLLVTSGAMTKRIDRLAAKGYVERIDGADDRRSSLVRLTRSGRALADGAIRRVTWMTNLLLPDNRASRTASARADDLVRRMYEALDQVDVSKVGFLSKKAQVTRASGAIKRAISDRT